MTITSEETLVQAEGEETTPFFLPFEMVWIPVERLIIPDEETIRVTQDTIESVRNVGILHSPIVEQTSGSSLSDPQATFRVIVGRKRCKWAKLAGLGLVYCKAYAKLSDEVRAAFVLNENWNRSPSWVLELQALDKLVKGKIGMNDKQIARATGTNIASVREHLKIVQLPQAILDQVFESKMSKETVKRITRLSAKQQARLIVKIEAGEEITGEVVKSCLHEQISGGLDGLEAMLDASPSQDSAPAVGRIELPFDEWIATLTAWEGDLAQINAKEARMLVLALRQEFNLLRQEKGSAA